MWIINKLLVFFKIRKQSANIVESPLVGICELSAVLGTKEVKPASNKTFFEYKRALFLAKKQAYLVWANSKNIIKQEHAETI